MKSISYLYVQHKQKNILLIKIKLGPPSCPKKYNIGYSLLLVCDDLVNIDIATKTGNTDYKYGSCKFKID